VAVATLQIHGTCLGFQLLHILVSNVSRNDLLIETDSVTHPSTLLWTGKEKDSRMFGTLPVSTAAVAAPSRTVAGAAKQHLFVSICFSSSMSCGTRWAFFGRPLVLLHLIQTGFVIFPSLTA
jgi:hypothetical protein